MKKKGYFKFLMYWIKSGIEEVTHHDPRRVNNKSVKFRNERTEIWRKLEKGGI